MTRVVTCTELRGRFAQRLSDLYGTEVPAYRTLLEVTDEVNQHVRAGSAGVRVDDTHRVAVERHGAIRVGSPRELAQVARVFSAFGMRPVGFYDLRAASGSGIPVVSTAFRPIDEQELAANPFRVFPSMLTVDDARYFDTGTQLRLEEFIAARRLFSPKLLRLADRAGASGGLPAAEADELLERATAAFRLSREPVDRDWYDHLAAISSVAADIGGTASTHINHLTPRVLDIDKLFTRMTARGIEMSEGIQGPPAWEGPELLLRQTSFKALAEPRTFRLASGELTSGELRVRFGEVEQRGAALTRAGFARYAAVEVELAERGAGLSSAERDHIKQELYRSHFPCSLDEFTQSGLAWFTYRLAEGAPQRAVESSSLSELVATKVLLAEPIVYEDFLPQSAAGIFRSNLTTRGSRDDSLRESHYDVDRLAGMLEMPVHDPQDLYRAQQDESLRAVGAALGTAITNDIACRAQEPRPR